MRTGRPRSQARRYYAIQSKRPFETENPQRTVAIALPEFRHVGNARAIARKILRCVTEVSDTPEEREVFGQCILRDDIDEKTL